MEKTLIKNRVPANKPQPMPETKMPEMKAHAADAVAAAIQQLNEATRRDAESLAVEKQRSESLAAELAATIAKLHEREAASKVKEKALEARIQELRMEMNSVQPARKALETQGLALVESQKALEARNKDTEERLKAAQAEIAALRTRVANVERERDGAERARQDSLRKVSETNAVNAAFTALQAEHGNLATSYRSFHENAHRVNNELKEALQKALNEAATLRRERDHLRKAFLVADNASNQMRGTLREATLKLAAAEPTISSQAKQIKEMAEELRFAKATAEKFTVDCKNLREDIVRLSAENTTAAEELYRARILLEGANARIKALDEAATPGMVEKVRRWDHYRREIFEESKAALARLNELRSADPLKNDPKLSRDGISVVEQLEALLAIANRQLLDAEQSFESIIESVKSGAGNPPPPPRAAVIKR